MKNGLSIALFFLLSFSTVVLGQESKESDDSLIVKKANNQHRLNFQSTDLNRVDGFQNYRLWGAHHLPYARSGNLGLAAHPLSVPTQDWNIHHNIGAYQSYALNKDSMQFYQVSRPVTQLFYANGAEAEQRFIAFHTQNLGEGLNISFQYDRMTSEGFFLQQLTNHTRFFANYNLHSRNKRFHSKGYYMITNLKSQENGGVFLSDEESAEENTVLLDIHLFDAQNRSRSQEFGLENQYDLIRLDSNTTLFNLYHQFNYLRSYRNYDHDLTNSNQEFYRSNYFDQTFAADSAYVDEISNELGVQLFNHRLSA
ncbi:MAG: putative porin, partial [Vicingaceae bacterium]